MKTVVLLLFTFFFCSNIIVAQKPSCCDKPECRKKAELLSTKVAGMSVYLKAEQDEPVKNKATLDSLKAANPALYKDFVIIMKEAVVYMNTYKQDMCFIDNMPSDIYGNAYDWITYFNDSANPVKFPSAEFCTGFKKRIELSQGAANLFKKSMTYSASLRAYLSYTFGKKGNCGNGVRISAGPAGFLKGSNSYLALSTRAAFRLKDIAPKNFAIGNLNLFTEYNSNFDHFNFVAAGVEAELGALGFNLAVNMDTKGKSFGFLTGFFLQLKK